MANNSKKIEKQRDLKKETLAIIILALAVFLCLALFSYSPNDPSFNTVHIEGAEINNHCGIVGSYLADILLQLIGLSSYLIPLVLILMSLNIFFSQYVKIVFVRIFGFILFLISSAGLFYLFYKDVPLVKSGGLVGYFIGKFVSPYISEAGSFIILFALMCVAVIMATQISVLYMIEIAKELLIITGKGLVYLKSIFTVFYEKFKNFLSGLIDKSEEAIKEGLDEIKYNVEEPKLPRPVVKENKPEEITIRQKTPEKKTHRKKTLQKVDFKLPSLDLLNSSEESTEPINKEELFRNSRILENKLKDFGVYGKVVEVEPGPIITMYEFEPAPGVKLNKITRLADDLAMALKALSVRIVAPIPGKAVVGIEIPNKNRETVYLKDIIGNETFDSSQSILTICLGKNISGLPIVSDMRKMPHLLVAGATGTGKSVFVNSLIMSILYKASPSEAKFIMVDPKMLELSTYEGIPHLLLPVVTDPKKAAKTLRWAVSEMERRYRLMADVGVRHIEGYNRKVNKVMEERADKISQQEIEEVEEARDTLFEKPEEHKGKLPYIIVVIDELADLMVVSLREVEESLTRLSQMARASGIHLILATQRPSVDVITGVIKANFPARVSFQVSSKVDSRTIIDQNGAEHLLGSGDMLYLPPGTAKIQRIHGAFVSDSEIKDVTDYLKEQAKPEYDEDIIKASEEEMQAQSEGGEIDEMYDQALALVKQSRMASISMIQRKLRIGYNRAARIVETMEEQGIVSHAEAGKPREVIFSRLDQII